MKNKQELSIKWMLEKHPGDTLWLFTKKSGKETATIPNNYWMIGLFDFYKPVMGEPLRMTRLANSKNPEGRCGMFVSTPVVFSRESGNGWVVKTYNSVYELKKLNSVMDVVSEKCKGAGFDPYKNE